MIFLAIALVGLWLGVNLWPYAQEPELFNEEALAFTEIPAENGWNLLAEAKSPLLEIPLDETYDKIVPSGMLKLLPEENFWNDIEKRFREDLLTHASERAPFVQAYERLLIFPQFIDNDATTIDGQRGRVGLLINYHKIGQAYILERALQNDWETAYAFWLKMFRQNLAWLDSARSLVSHMGAIVALRDSVNLLERLKQKFLPSNWEGIQATLHKIDFSKMSLERAMIFEYRWTRNGIDLALVKPEIMMSSLPPWRQKIWNYFYNSALTMCDCNAIFRRYLSLLSDPMAIPEDIDKQIQGEFPFVARKGLWWFANPVGKGLLATTAFNYGEPIRKFYQEKEGLQKKVQIFFQQSHENKKINHI